MADETKRRLAELLARQAHARSEPRAGDPFAASAVRLHAGGGKRPFFCVHPGSGTVGCFSEIAPLVDADRPFIGLQAPGVDGDCEPIEDLAALARGYVGEVRRVQPRGPYAIGGWSLGGTIAFQMAHELRRAGETVALLVLFDTQRAEALHEARIPRPEAIEINFRQSAYATVHLARQRGVTIDPAVAADQFRREQPRTTPARLQLMLQLLVEHGVFTDATAPIFKVFRANVSALGNYGMPVEPYDGRITLFRCRNDAFGDAYARVDPGYCWSRVTTQPLDIVAMPSHHFALFHGEVLPQTASELRRCLDAVEAA